MNWASSQHNISSSLGLQQTTQLLIGQAAWSRCEECTLPTSTVASRILDRQRQDSSSVIEFAHICDILALCLASIHMHSVILYFCTSFRYMYISNITGIDVLEFVFWYHCDVEIVLFFVAFSVIKTVVSTFSCSQFFHIFQLNKAHHFPYARGFRPENSQAPAGKMSKCKAS